jgi:hypothetical protein
MSRDELVTYVDGGGDISELLFGALRRSALTHPPRRTAFGQAASPIRILPPRRRFW